MLKLGEIGLNRRVDRIVLCDSCKKIAKTRSIHQTCKQGIDYLDKWKLNNRNYILYQKYRLFAKRTTLRFCNKLTKKG